MNDKIYKSTFNNITVSEDVLNDVISKAELLRGKNTCKPQKHTRFLIITAAVFATSVITVTAASYLGVSDVFKGFYSQFLGSETLEFNQGQKDFFEKNGAAKIGGFSEDGIKLDVEGLIGDRQHLFLKYSVSYEDFNYPAPPELYIGDLTNGIGSAGYVSNCKPDNTNKMNYASIFNIDSDILHSAKNATFVITSTDIYKPIHIDLFETYKKYGISAPVNSQDFFDILSEGRINTPFDNEFGGKIILKSMGFADNSLTLVVDSSRYYKHPQLYLQNKKTGKIYSECNGFNLGIKLGLSPYSFKIDSIDSLKDLEIVMPKEYYFEFPLSYVDSTRSIDTGKLSASVQRDPRINTFNISPLSLNISGYCTDSSHPTDITIKLTDMTELNDFKNCFIGCRNPDNSFDINVLFESPVMLDSIKSVVIKCRDKVIEIPIK